MRFVLQGTISIFIVNLTYACLTFMQLAFLETHRMLTSDEQCTIKFAEEIHNDSMVINYILICQFIINYKYT